jgi:hypothetical protein
LKIVALIIVLVLIGTAWVGWQQLAPRIDVTDSMAYLLKWQGRPIIETRLGEVRGVSNDRANAFLGIPYVQAPTGDRRFMPILIQTESKA